MHQLEGDSSCANSSDCMQAHERSHNNTLTSSSRSHPRKVVNILNIKENKGSDYSVKNCGEYKFASEGRVSSGTS